MRGQRFVPLRPVSIALLAALSWCVSAGAAVPAVRVSYADSFDEICQQETTYIIEPSELKIPPAA